METDRAEEIRQAAEAMVSAQEGQEDEDTGDEKTKRLIYELRVHQIELEMQNEELRDSQAELRRAQRRYESLFEYAPIGYLVLDREGVIREANYFVAGMLRTERKLLIRKPFIVFVPREHHGAFYNHIARVYESAHQQSSEMQITTRNGDTVWGRFESRLQRDADDVEMCLTAVIDITDRRKIEDDLILAREDAIRANKIKSMFLANMSHEVRTPMNGILVSAELAMETTEPDEQPRLLQAIHSSAKSLIGVIDDILDFSKIEENRLSIEKRPFDVRDILRNSIDLFAPMASQKGLTLDVSFDEGLSQTYEGDPVRIRQIVYNLLGNAVKFTDTGGVTVLVRSKALNEYLHELTIEVSDTGPGIPPEQQNRIFESFTQGEDGYRRRHQGTGLGLTISRRLAKLMGGQLYFTSRADEGATFFFSLPLHASEILEATSGDLSPEGDPPGAASPAAHILVAEDNAINILVLQKILERAGHTVTKAYNGKEAIDRLRETPFDIVFMDVAMPEMDGVEATERIRSGEAGQERASVPIVAITAHSMTGDRADFLHAGADEYISKPFTKADVLGCVETILRRKRDGSGVAPGEPTSSSGKRAENDRD